MAWIRSPDSVQVWNDTLLHCSTTRLIVNSHAKSNARRALGLSVFGAKATVRPDCIVLEPVCWQFDPPPPVC